MFSERLDIVQVIFASLFLESFQSRLILLDSVLSRGFVVGCLSNFVLKVFDVVSDVIYIFRSVSQGGLGSGDGLLAPRLFLLEAGVRVVLIIVLALSAFASAQNAFGKIKTALYNFRDSINTEQNDADIRHKKEVAWCKDAIKKAQATLDHRTNDVNDIGAHIKYLENEITQTQNDKDSRASRIKQNKLTLERFKKERCENNLNYIKSLREHKESIDIMKLLRADLDAYFTKWMKNPTSGDKIEAGLFIEKLSRFAHLFDDEHRNIFVQLVQSIKDLEKKDDLSGLQHKTDDYTSVSARTSAQIGTGHIDNTRGALKALEAPAVVEAREYVIQLRAKTLGMIDALIKHLEASRKKLSEDEMLANEHFADFQAQMFKENKYLAEKIEEDTKTLLSLNSQLKKSKGQYDRREKLKEEAEENLKAIRKNCKSKNDYYKKENARRKNELSITSSAIATYNNIVTSINARLASRVDDNVAGAKYSDKDINERNVADYRKTVHTDVSANLKARNEVVL